MGIYKVQSNGKAPAGLSVGDQVVTGGGTYLITGVNPDGSYSSTLYNRAQTTANYSGRYDAPRPAAARPQPNNATPSDVYAQAQQRSQTTTAAEAAAAEDKLENYYLKLLDQAMNNQYQPVAPAPATVKRALSLEEAVTMAEQAMEPQYAARYQQAADNAAQRLDRAGLYDTLYGQALSAEAENRVSQDLNAAVWALALQLTNADADHTRDILDLAVRERQFGADYDAAQRQQALNYLIKLIQH